LNDEDELEPENVEAEDSHEGTGKQSTDIQTSMEIQEKGTPQGISTMNEPGINEAPVGGINKHLNPNLF